MKNHFTNIDMNDISRVNFAYVVYVGHLRRYRFVIKHLTLGTSIKRRCVKKKR
jgi:hypothetical protein